MVELFEKSVGIPNWFRIRYDKGNGLVQLAMGMLNAPDTVALSMWLVSVDVSVGLVFNDIVDIWQFLCEQEII